MDHTYPLVSVIVPVYKVEKYLEQCVTSIRNQTYTNLEIILVNDGSPDCCGEMCDQYAAADTRIKVIHQENGGLSDARNAGMKIANGSYLFFVDSDDYLRQDAVMLLVSQALDNDADLVCGSYQSFVDGSVPKKNVNLKQAILLDQLSAMQHFALQDWGAWGKLYRREIHAGIEFPYGKIHEDEAIMFRLLARCQRVVCLEDELYFYRNREGSITAASYSIKKMDWMDAWMENVAFVKAYYPNVYAQCLSKALTVALYNIEHLVGKQEYCQQLFCIQHFLRKHWLRILFNSFITASSRLRVIIFILSNPKKKRCLYCTTYGLLVRLRGKKHA